MKGTPFLKKYELKDCTSIRIRKNPLPLHVRTIVYDIHIINMVCVEMAAGGKKEKKIFLKDRNHCITVK